MSGILVNTAKVANGEVENAQAIITTQDAQRKGFASFEIGNFFNASAPVLKNYSEFEVNGALSRFQAGDETVKYLGNDVGDTLEEATAAPQNVVLYLCILPYTSNSFEFVVRGNITVSYDNALGGIYENGTTTRIIGGCVYTGSSWTNKWAINNAELLMTGVNPFIKMCGEGLDVNIRKIIGAYQPGIVDNPISNYTPTASEASSGIINATIEVNYKCILHVWVQYASAPKWKLADIGKAMIFASTATTAAKFVSLFGDDSVIGIGLLRQHTDGSWIPYTSPVKISGFNSTYNNKSVCLSVDPGVYRIAPIAGFKYHGAGASESEETLAPGIAKMSVSVLAVQGTKVGY